ncbi:MAG TPA: 3-hydroxyacyl-ACP dehydratase FabZ [Steroidobacteraceae bacterium]|nr:3-hydroxyacyl-ACP dehydratase FabZ [Steroidobacteraceae bacterium]
MTDAITLDINGIMKRLPHRYPFLLVDRVLECVRGERIRGLKNVTYNEPYFLGHFPHRPLMPGVIIVEALAQVTGLLAFLSADELPDDTTRFYFVGIDKARFRRPVEPGDQLILHSQFERNVKGIWRCATMAEVAGQEVAHAHIMIAPDLKRDVGAPPEGELP